MTNILGLENINESLQIHFLIYKITNIINNKYYIGQHKTRNPLDNYFGSGTLLNYAIQKYGIQNFKKEILFDFDNFDEMNIKEQELVPLSSCYPYNNMSYNLKEGGNQGQFSELTIKRMSENNKKENNPFYGKQHSIETINKISQVKKGSIPPNKGKKMSEEQKQKLRKPKSDISKYKNRIAHLGKKVSIKTKQKISMATKGENNPCYGRKWMYNPTTKDKIYPKKEECQKYLEQGYIFGIGKKNNS